MKKVNSNPKFEFGDVVQYNSSKKGRLILVISRLEWHLKEQVFYYYADHSGKQDKKRLSGELTLFDVQELSKTISHALRLEPQVCGLELLEGGWVLQEDLIKSLASFNNDWENIDTNLLQVVVDNSIKKRHEVKSEFIGAKYGHTANVKLDFTPTTPSSILFHGTSRKSSPSNSNWRTKPSSSGCRNGLL